MAELAFSKTLADGLAATAAATAESSPATENASQASAAAAQPAAIDYTAFAPSEIDPNEQAAVVEPALAALCVPLSDADPCGPDLDLAGDTDYLNFLAQTEGMLPSSFFSTEDGRPFDRASVDLPRQVDAIARLWQRSRDLRLLVIRARLLILNRDLGGFALAIAAIAHWLDKFWDEVHPRADHGEFDARVAALSALDLPTVVFPLQYAPLCEGRRIGAVSYRAWMIAAGDVKPRPGEQKHPPAALTEAIADAPVEILSATRKHVALLRRSLARIREIFMMHGSAVGLDSVTALTEKLQAFIDPRAALEEGAAARAAEADGGSAPAMDSGPVAVGGSAPTSLAEAQQALAAIAGYYSCSEPSSPTLPLVRQAHQLIGKSFFEVMSILVPTQMDKAAFQIGADQFFELPIGKLSKLAEGTPSVHGDGQVGAESGRSVQYQVSSRAQAIALLEQVQRFFRLAEPSSPVPMLCDRARALAERDFMGVLREVLPKAALKNFGVDK